MLTNRQTTTYRETYMYGHRQADMGTKSCEFSLWEKTCNVTCDVSRVLDQNFCKVVQ